MSRLGYHIRFRLRDDGVIAATMEERRVLARCILEHGRSFALYAFGYPDTHVHLVARVERRGAGRLAQAIEVSLKRRLGLSTGFAQHEPRPLIDNAHMYNTVRYVLRQTERHKLDVDPLREGSNLLDLAGLRVLGSYTADNVRRWLPRLGRHELLEMLGVAELVPVDGEVDQVIPAAMAASCCSSLTGSTREVVALRHAIIEVIGRRLPARDIAALLDCSRREIERRRQRPADPGLVRAIRLQLCLQEQKKHRAT